MSEKRRAKSEGNAAGTVGQDSQVQRTNASSREQEWRALAWKTNAEKRKSN